MRVVARGSLQSCEDEEQGADRMHGIPVCKTHLSGMYPTLPGRRCSQPPRKFEMQLHIALQACSLSVVPSAQRLA